MTAWTRNAYQIFGCWIPSAMHDDPPAWQGLWAHEVVSRGFEPAGQPTITEHDDRFGGPPRWSVEGPVDICDTPDEQEST